MAIDITKTQITNYDVTWSSFAFGSIDKIEIETKLQTKEIKVGSVGDVVLGHRVVGLEAVVRFEAREITLAMLQKVHPWWTTGSIPMLPAAALQDLYSYAALLTLHPTDAAAAVTEDRNYVKAVPMLERGNRDGVNDDKDMIAFLIYPDRAQLPTRIFGYIGAVP